MMSLDKGGALVVPAKACIRRNQLDELHVTGIDSLIAGCQRVRFLLREPSLQREPFRKPKVHIAFECGSGGGKKKGSRKEQNGTTRPRYRSILLDSRFVPFAALPKSRAGGSAGRLAQRLRRAIHHSMRRRATYSTFQ